MKNRTSKPRPKPKASLKKSGKGPKVTKPLANNPLRKDPTKTWPLVKRFMVEVSRGFRQLRKHIRELVDKHNVFGIGLDVDPTTNSRTLTVNVGEWIAETSQGKVVRFRSWLRKQMDTDLAGDDLVQHYIDQSYRKGVNRAYSDANKMAQVKAIGGTPEEQSFQAGAREQFNRTTFSQKATVDKVKLLAGRTFTDLEDVNMHMGTKMNRILVDGLVTEKSHKEMAEEMVEQTNIDESRAMTIVRTEMIRAHAEGQLDSLDAQGVESVGADVEWDAGPGACEECSALAGETYTIEEARGLIPAHPNCRCAWIPVSPEDDAVKAKDEEAKGHEDTE